MKTFEFPCIEALESRLAPAGLIAVSVSASGTLVLANIAGQDGDENVTIDRLDNGSYQLTPGAGVMLQIGGNLYSSPQIVYGVYGGLTANLGAGNDLLALSDCFFSKAVTVNLGHGNNTFSMTDSSIAGALKVTSGDGLDTVNFYGSACAIGGAATFKLGGGQDIIATYAGRMGFGAGLTFDGGAGADGLYLGIDNGNDVRVIGNVKFTGGTGNDVFYLGWTNTTLSVTGSVTMTDTEGNDLVSLAGLRLDAGALVLQVGNGNNTLGSTVTELVTAKNFQWVSGTGQDTFTIDGTSLRVGTTLDVAIGSGPGTVDIGPTDLVSTGGTLKLSATGTDVVARSLILQAADIIVGGKLTVSAGAGNGTLQVYGLSSLYLGGGAAFSSGAGNSNLNLWSINGLVSNGSVSLLQNSGDGMTYIYGGSGGDSVINGSVSMKGGDSVSLTMAGMVTGTLTMATSPTPFSTPSIGVVTNGTDGITIAGAATLSLPSVSGGSGAVSLYGAIFESTLTIKTGAGGDTIAADNIMAFKAVNVNMGAGADTFRVQNSGFTGSSNFFGAVSVLGGAGADSFFLGGNTASTNGVTFRNAVTLDGGTETDAVTVGTQAAFAPTYSLKLKNIP
jgi:hypothetical protein